MEEVLESPIKTVEEGCKTHIYYRFVKHLTE